MDALQRLAILRQGPCVPADYIRDYYGLPWPFTGDLQHDFEIWRGGLRRPVHCEGDAFSRFEIEGFMEQRRIVPRKWMAASLGMTEGSLDELLTRLPQLGLRPSRYLPYNDLVATDLVDDLVGAIPALRYRTFGDHNTFCARLHSELQSKEAPSLGIQVEPLYCATALELGEELPQFAKHFDCLTLEPLSEKHAVWLDFGKPLSLAPDRCSKLFYAAHRTELSQYCAGHMEPDNIGHYEQFVAAERSRGS